MKKIFIIISALCITITLKAQSESETKNFLRAGLQVATFENEELGPGVYVEYARKFHPSFAFVASLNGGFSEEKKLEKDELGAEYLIHNTYNYFNTTLAVRYTPFYKKNKWVSIDAGFYYQYLQNFGATGNESSPNRQVYIYQGGSYAFGNQVGLLVSLVGAIPFGNNNEIGLKTDRYLFIPIGTYYTDVTMNTVGIFYSRKF